jgi:hypothetical protein
LKTEKAIPKLRGTVFPHPPYSLELNPSDFCLFGALKAIRGKMSGRYDKVGEEVTAKYKIPNGRKGRQMQGCWR